MECKINNDLGQITISEDVLLLLAVYLLGFSSINCFR